MDIIAHGLWTGAVYKAANFTKKKPFRVWWAVFWGTAPDIFSFALPVLWVIWHWVSGGLDRSLFVGPENGVPPAQHLSPIFPITRQLYSFSHSAIVFAAVFLLVVLVQRRFMWEMGGWLLHIFIDILTHSYRFYPTPFLWPISDWRFHGIGWRTPWFMAVNYSTLLMIYLFFWLRARKLKTKGEGELYKTGEVNQQSGIY